MPDRTAERCSIIIRAYNEERHIGRLLDGISHQGVQNPEIILVDSGSTDRTNAIASHYPVKILHIRPQEFSFGRSLNLGIASAQHERVVIASAHVYPVYPDWLERLLAPFSDPNIALSYGKQRGDEASYFSEKQVFTRWYPDISNLHQSHPFCNNANAAIRRSLWKFHPYDETITGLEDLSWGRWAMGQGHSIAYIAEAEVVHIHHENPGGVYNRFRREAMAYKQIFPSERFNLAEFLKLVTGNIASDLQSATRQKCLRRSLYSIIWFRLMQFWGTYQGYRHPGSLTAQLRRTFYYPNQARGEGGAYPRDIEPIRYRERS